LKYKEVIDSNVDYIIKSKKFSKLKVTASDENIYAVAAAIAANVFESSGGDLLSKQAAQITERNDTPLDVK
jgi:hypothetical protein